LAKVIKAGEGQAKVRPAKVSARVKLATERMARLEKTRERRRAKC
jgi:hypothetical protein